MSLEGIVDLLFSRNITLSELVYHQPLVSVYRGDYQTYPAAIKVHSVTASTTLRSIEHEYHTMLSLSHPNIVRLYDYFWTPQDAPAYLVIVSEWCDKDLAKDSQQRKSSSFPWPEDELWGITRALVDAFCYMQEQKYAHRDIKPENIFLSPNKVPMIGDFGSSLQTEAEFAMRTVTGTPVYLSPVLKAGLVRNQRRISHNVFKSDVYSLGLTLLAITHLEPPISLLTQGGTQQATTAAIDACFYSQNFKDLLASMLVIEETARPDFLDLARWMLLRPASPASLPELMEAEEEEKEERLEGNQAMSNQGYAPQESGLTVLNITSEINATPAKDDEDTHISGFPRPPQGSVFSPEAYYPSETDPPPFDADQVYQQDETHLTEEDPSEGEKQRHEEMAYSNWFPGYGEPEPTVPPDEITAETLMAAYDPEVSMRGDHFTGPQEENYDIQRDDVEGIEAIQCQSETEKQPQDDITPFGLCIHPPTPEIDTLQELAEPIPERVIAALAGTNIDATPATRSSDSDRCSQKRPSSPDYYSFCRESIPEGSPPPVRTRGQTDSLQLVFPSASEVVCDSQPVILFDSEGVEEEKQVESDAAAIETGAYTEIPRSSIVSQTNLPSLKSPTLPSAKFDTSVKPSFQYYTEELRIAPVNGGYKPKRISGYLQEDEEQKGILIYIEEDQDKTVNSEVVKAENKGVETPIARRCFERFCSKLCGKHECP